MRIFTPIFIMLAIAFTGFIVSLMRTHLGDGMLNEVRANRLDMPPSLQQTIIEYEEYIDESLCQSGTPGAAIAIVKGSDVVYLQGFGVKDQNTGEIVDIHTVFRLASVSKCLTSALTGTMVEDSLLAWDDPVTQHLANFSLKSPEQTNNLTIKHLLSHTTGFPYHAYTNLIEEGRSLSSLMLKLQNLDLVSPVGQLYSYQNVAFSIIDKVVESSTGKSFEENMRERLFKPLNMEDVSMSYEDIYNSHNVALPHLRYKRQWKRIPLSSTYYNVAPAGGVNASIADMGKWLRAMLGNDEEIISINTINQLFEPVVKANPKNRNFNRWQKIKESYYGLGWRILCFKNDTIAYHGGYIKGYRSEVVIHPREKIGICVLANGAGRFSNRAIPTFLSLYYKHHYGIPVEKKPL